MSLLNGNPFLGSSLASEPSQPKRIENPFLDEPLDKINKAKRRLKEREARGQNVQALRDALTLEELGRTAQDKLEEEQFREKVRFTFQDIPILNLINPPIVDPVAGPQFSDVPGLLASPMSPLWPAGGQVAKALGSAAVKKIPVLRSILPTFTKNLGPPEWQLPALRQQREALLAEGQTVIGDLQRLRANIPSPSDVMRTGQVSPRPIPIKSQPVPPPKTPLTKPHLPTPLPIQRPTTEELRTSAFERATDFIAEALAAPEERVEGLLIQRIKGKGGIAPYKKGVLREEYRAVPVFLRNNRGLPPDEMAAELGLSGDSELFELLRTYKTRLQPYRQQALDELRRMSPGERQEILDLSGANSILSPEDLRRAVGGGHDAPTTGKLTESKLLARLRERSAAPENIKEILVPPSTLLETHSNRQIMEQARVFVEGNPAGARDHVLSSTMLDDTGMEVGRLLIRDALASRNEAEAVRLIHNIAPKARSAGQTVQILKLWSQLSPEWIVKTAELEFQQVQRAMPKAVAKMEAQAQEAVTALTQHQAQAGEAVAKMMERIAQKSPSVSPSRLPPSTLPIKEQQEIVPMVQPAKMPWGMIRPQKVEFIRGQQEIVPGVTPLDPHGPEMQLAEKVKRYLHEPKPKKVDLEKEANALAVRTLFQVAKETLPPKVPPTPENLYTVIGTALDDRVHYKAIWEKAQEVVRGKLRTNPDLAVKAEAYLQDLLREPFPVQKLQRLVTQELSADPTMRAKMLASLIRQHYSAREASRQDLVARIVETLGVGPDDANSLTTYISSLHAEMLDKARRAYLKNLVGSGETIKQKATYERIFELANTGALDRSDLYPILGKKLGLPILTPKLARSLTDQSLAIQAMKPDGWEREFAVAKMMDTIAAEIPPSTGQKASTLLYLAQLLNFKTPIRNLGGNAFLFAMKNAADTVGAGVDRLLSLKTGRRALVVPSLKTQLLAGREGVKHGFAEALAGVTTRPGGKFFEQQRSLIQRGRTFRHGVRGKGETLLSILLGVPDRGFLDAAYAGSLENQMRAAGAMVATEEMKDRAIRESLRQILLDENVLSQAAIAFKRTLNLGKKFGAGNFLLNYPGVPANLVMEFYKYSPFALPDAVIKILQVIRGAGDQRAASEAMGRVLVGTAGIGMTGYLLAKLGAIRTREEDRSRLVTAIQREVGRRDYQINVGFLKRLLASGLDPTTPREQPGDLFLSYDWALPGSALLTAGAEVALATTKEEKARVISSGMLNALLESSDQLAQQALLTGITKFQREWVHRSLPSAVGTALQEVPAAFVPQIINQVRQVIDPYKRETYLPGGAGFPEAGTKVMAKLPGVSFLLPRSPSIFGEDRLTYGQPGTNTLFNVFLNPAVSSRYAPSPEAKLAIELYQATGEKGHLPRVIGKRVNVSGKMVQLTRQEYLDMQRFVGEKTQQAYEALINDGTIASLDPEKQVKVLAGLMQDIGLAAKIQILGHQPARNDLGAFSVLQGAFRVAWPKGVQP